MTTTIQPIATGSAGEASQIAVQSFDGIPSDILTALKNGSGNLELITWNTFGDQVKREATALAGEVDEVALALVDRQAVTAVRNGSGDLELISWDIPHPIPPQPGTVTRRHDNHAGEASNIAITVCEGFLVTALQNGSGNLEVITWALGSDGTITRRGTNEAGAVSRVAVCTLGGTSNVVITAVRNGSGNLELIAWAISSDGETITRKASTDQKQAGAVGEISIACLRQTDFRGVPGVLTAVSTGAGRLLVIVWQVAPDGSSIERRGDSNDEAGEATDIAIAPGGLPPTYVATMRNGSGDLELIAFDILATGAVTRSGSVVPWPGTDTTETAIAPLGGPAVTATRTRDFLYVSTWNVLTQP
jgi:hypothetical protein